MAYLVPVPQQIFAAIFFDVPNSGVEWNTWAAPWSDSATFRERGVAMEDGPVKDWGMDTRREPAAPCEKVKLYKYSGPTRL